MAIIPKYNDRPKLSAVTYGVTLGVYPSSDASFDVEIQRASGSSTGTFTQIAQLNPEDGQSSLLYTDLTPSDNVTRCYRARHVGSGYTAGAYTAIVSAKPAAIVGGGTNLVGRNVTKELVIPYNAFVVNQSTTLGGKVTLGSGFVYNSLVVSAGPDRRIASCPVSLPRRVRLVGLAVTRYYSSNSSGASINDVILYRVTSTGIPTIANIDSTTHFGNQVLSTSFGYTPTTSESLACSVTLGSDVTATGSAVRSVSIKYRYPLGDAQAV